jgi:hypothetical protein
MRSTAHSAVRKRKRRPVGPPSKDVVKRARRRSGPFSLRDRGGAIKRRDREGEALRRTERSANVGATTDSRLTI